MKMLSMLVWKEGLHALKWKHFQMKMYQSGRALSHWKTSVMSLLFINPFTLEPPMQNLPCTVCDIISFKSHRHLPCAEETDLSNHTRMSMIQSNRFEKNEWFQKLSIPPPHRGFFPGSPPPLPLCQASYINSIFGPLRSPHPPGISNHFPVGSTDISWNYTMQKKTWPKNNCHENLTPLPNCYFFHLNILRSWKFPI